MTTADGRPRPRPLPYPREDPPHELPSGTPIDSIDAAMHREPRADHLPLPRWIGALAVGSVVGFLPWIVYLGFTLPTARSKAPADDSLAEGRAREPAH